MVLVNRFRFLFLAFSLVAFASGSSAATVVIDTCADCGATGGMTLRETINNINAPSETAFAVVDKATFFAPSTITGINASVDKDFILSQVTPFTISISSGFRPVLEQDGTVFMVNPSITGPTITATTPVTSLTTGWGTIQCDPTNSTGCPNGQTSLTLSNFVAFNFATGTFGTATPNSSDPIFFGLGGVTTINNTAITNGTSVSLFANLSLSDGPLLVDSNFADFANYQVFEFVSPEPSTLFLLGPVVAGLCWRGKKKFRK